MTLLDTLFRFYSFSKLVDLIINDLGFSTLIVLLLAYFAAIVYFSALPAKSPFSTETSRSKAVGFFQQAFYIFSFVTLLMPWKSGWASFFLVLSFYVPIISTTGLNWFVTRNIGFNEYLKFRRDGPKSMIWKFSGLACLWIAILSELLVFLIYDPSIPLIGWVVILYSLGVAILQAVLAQSYLSHISSCLYAKIETIDGLKVEGFIFSKGSDHYIVKSKEKDVLLSNWYVKSIYQSPLPEK